MIEALTLILDYLGHDWYFLRLVPHHMITYFPRSIRRFFELASLKLLAAFRLTPNHPLR